MSQFDMTTDTNFGQDIQDSLQALTSNSKGGSAPGTLYSGQLWLDDTTATAWVLKITDGTSWTDLATIDPTTNSFAIPNAANVLRADQNLSDVDHAPTSLSNIGGIGHDTIHTLTHKTFDANDTGNSLSNVDVADLADGTDGELITWSAAGTADTVAVGTTGQVLTSNGAGMAPTFETIAGGGDMLSTNNLAELTDVAAARTTLGLDTMATQDANAVAITGGSITGITDLAVADGGTGASVAATALSNLGGIGPNTVATLTYKTIDANATGNAISNIDIGNAIAASQAEAEAGTDNTKLVTPLRVKQAISAAGATGWVPLQTETITSAVSSVDFTSNIDSTYKAYVFVLKNMVPVTDDVAFRIATSTDGGSSYDTTTGDYDFLYHPRVSITGEDNNTTVAYAFRNADGTGGQGGTHLEIAQDVGNASGEGFCSVVWMFEPSNTSRFTMFKWETISKLRNGGGKCHVLQGGGMRDSAADVDAVRFVWESGNHSAGEITLYGLEN